MRLITKGYIEIYDEVSREDCWRGATRDAA